MRFALGAILTVLSLILSIHASPLGSSPQGVNRRSPGAARKPASVRAMTNAARMAAGLPPNKPRIRASRTGTAARSLVSNMAFNGKIKIVNPANNQVIGYVGDNDGIVNNVNGATVFKATLPSTPGTTFELMRSNGNNKRLALIATSNNDRTIGSGSFRHLEFGVVNGVSTQAGDKPAASGSDWAETTIWMANIATDQLTAQWVNQNGGQPTTYFVSINGKIHATGDPAAYGSNEGKTATVVQLYLVPS